LLEIQRQVVVVARERGIGEMRTWVVAKEADAVAAIRQTVASGTEIHADESGAWNILHASYPMKRVNHSVEFKSDDGSRTNQAESYFSRLRRSEFGIQRPPSTSLCRRDGVARGQPPRRERDAVEVDYRRRAGCAQEPGMGRLLAPGARGMSNEITMNALVVKRAEILFEIREAEKRIAQLQVELIHLDAMLRMFRPDFKTEGLPVRHRRPTKSPYFTHGELTQRIFNAFRVNGTVTSFEIAAQAMRDKGLDPENDKPTRTDFVRRVALALGHMHRKGKVEKIGRGRAMRWKLAP
jgi:ISXO2-like transposase domain